MSAYSKALLAVLPLALGCNVAAGDYKIYRIAFAEAQFGEECFPNGIDPNDEQDTSSFRAGDTIAIYKGQDGAIYLDTPEFVLEGTKSEGNLVFTGEEVDVEFFGAGDASFTTNTESITVTLDENGTRLTGTANEDVDQTCNGADCQSFDTFACGSTSDFIGTRVRADIEYQL